MNGPFVKYENRTLDEQYRRVLERCEPEPGSDLTLPTDRADDHTPCVDHPLRSTRVLRLADAGGTTCVRQPTGTPDLPDAA